MEIYVAIKIKCGRFLQYLVIPLFGMSIKEIFHLSAIC
jgi:hypothetical protein